MVFKLWLAGWLVVVMLGRKRKENQGKMKNGSKKEEKD